MPRPEMLTDCDDIPQSLKITDGGEKFLYCDSGWLDPQRLIIFATPSNSGNLEDLKMVLRKHVFHIARCFLSRIYYSWRSISKKLLNIVLVHTILPNKKHGLLKALNLTPYAIRIAFGLTVGNALNAISSDVRKEFSYLHFCYALVRRVRNRGKNCVLEQLKTYLRKERMVTALAYVPTKNRITKSNLPKDYNSDTKAHSILVSVEK